MPGGNGVSYAISLESRQFLAELARVKQEAAKAAKEIESGVGRAGDAALSNVGSGAAKAAEGMKGVADAAKNVTSGVAQASGRLGEFASAGKNANAAMQVFQSVANAFSQAMSGNLVGAAVNATKAIKGLTAAMAANPIMLAIAAITALTVVVYKAAKAWSDYRQRVAEAKAEHASMLAELDAIRSGASSASEMMVNSQVSGFQQLVTEEKDIREAQRERDAQAKEVERRRKWAEQAHASGNEAEYEAAKSSYADSVSVLRQMDEILAKDKQDKADAKAANAAEAQRLKEQAAEGDSKAMQVLADKMAQEFEEKFGKGSLATYADRVASGKTDVSQEEIAAYKQLESYRKKAAEQAEREADAEARAKEKEASDAAQAALKKEAEAQKAADAEEKLGRSRENAMSQAGDAEGLTRLVGEKKLAFEMDYGVKMGDIDLSKATQEQLDAIEEVTRIEKEIANIRSTEARTAEQKAEQEKRRLEEAQREEEKLARSREAALVQNKDAKALRALAASKQAEFEAKYGSGAWDMARINSASQEELDAHAELERITGEAQRIESENAKAGNRQVDFLHRHDTDAQKLRRNSKQLRDAMKSGDVATAIDLMLEGEQIADSYQEEMSPSQKRRAERRARREQRAAMREARAYRRQVSRIEKAFASGKISEDEINESLAVENEGDPTKRKVMKGGKLTIETGSDLTNRLLTEIRDELK